MKKGQVYINSYETKCEVVEVNEIMRYITYRFTVDDSCYCGSMESFNTMLESNGYKPVVQEM